MRATVTRGLLVALVCLGVAAGSAHAAGWAPTTPIGAGDRGFLEVDLTPAGAATVVWRGVLNGQPAILASARPSGGAFTAPVPISTQASDVRSPSLAVSPNGIAVAAWAQRATPTGNWTLQAAMRSSSGHWSAPEPFDSSSSDPEPDVAISDDDEALVIWKTAEELRLGRVHVSSRPRGGAWSWPDTLTYPESTELQIVVDPRGSATALWLSTNGGSTSPMVLTKHRPAGGAWSTQSTELGGDLGDASFPHLAVGADGTVGAVWQEVGAVSRAAIRPPGGAWGDPEPLGFQPSFYPGERLGIAVDGAGTATAIGGRELAVETSRRPASGAWNATPEPLQEPRVTEHYYPTVVTNPRGFTLVGYLGYREHHPFIGDPVAQAAIRHPGGAWSSAIPIGEPGGFVAADVDGGANGLVVWTSPTGVVYGRAYDSTGPQIDPVVPAAAVAGTPAAFAATIRDDWSAPGTTTWDFGDGSTATGDGPSHTYAAPGRYAVRVTGSDALGNATSVERVVDVAPAPPSLALGSARFVRAGFDRSRLSKRARLLLEGTITAPVDVSVLLDGPLRPAADRRTFSLGVRRLAGGFSERIRIPKALLARMLPGEYVLRLTGSGLAPITQELELRAPPEGVVMARRISTSRNGPNLLRVTTAKQLWATFTFAPDGAARKRLRARWYAPGSDKPVGSFPVRRAFSYWQNPRGLAKGRWRCVLAGPDGVVESVSIRVG